MTFSSDDLLPKLPMIRMRQAIFRLPLTPFFNDATTLGSISSRSFKGNDFYLQFKSTNEDAYSDAEDQPICGYEGFRTFSSVGVKRSWKILSPVGTGTELIREEWSTTSTRSYEFNQETNQVQVLQTTNSEGPLSPSLYSNFHTRTPNQAKIGDPETDEDSEGPPPYATSTYHGTVTFTDPVDKGWLTGELNRWLDMPESFVEATGFGGQGATMSESDGWLAIVGGGRCAAQGPWFSGTPSGMVGNEGEKWNGNFSTYIRTVTRKNAPSLYRESGIGSDGVVIEPQANPLAVGRSIYRQGYSELALSEQIGHLWRDAFGVFEEASILDGFPMSPVYAYDLGSLLNYHGPGKANKLMLLSRTGKRYRVSLQAGRLNYQYDENDWDAEPIVSWVSVETYTLITDENLMATTSVGELENAPSIRVARIEEETRVNGLLQWVVVADADAYQQYADDLQNWQQAWNAWDHEGCVGNAPIKPPVMRDPKELIGPTVTGDFLLLATMKRRRGSRFGFPPLTYSPSTVNHRYRKKTFNLHLTPGSVQPYSGQCGLADLSGNIDYLWSEEFDAQFGFLQPREVQMWNASLNGVNWTPESADEFEYNAFPGSTVTEQSATKQRREGNHTWLGKLIVGFDEPYSRGSVVSIEWTSVGMNAIDGVNRTTSVSLSPPSSGHSLFFEGHRLTYTT